jgi:hypothetical protein
MNLNLTDRQLALYLASKKDLSIQYTLSIADKYYEWLKLKQPKK